MTCLHCSEAETHPEHVKRYDSNCWHCWCRSIAFGWKKAGFDESHVDDALKGLYGEGWGEAKAEVKRWADKYEVTQ